MIYQIIIDMTFSNLGVTQLESTQIDDSTLPGIGSYIIGTNKHDGRWYTVRLKSKLGTTGHFESASFSILWNLSSTAYGWAILISDNKGHCFTFGKLIGSNWHWYEIQKTELN